MRLVRPIAALATLAVFSVCYAQQAQIQLGAFPSMSVADGRSTTTITATVRDGHGNLAPDGTRVVFESTMGLFRETIVSTTQGVARAVLQAGGVPGIATITVKTVDGVSTPSTLEFEFKGDRSLLDSAMEYIELVSPKYMEFMPDTRIMAAAAPNHGVFIRYRDITITADDAQINISRYEVRARKATLKVGNISQEFDELYFKLNERTGIGSTNFTALMPAPVTFQGFTPIFLTDDLEALKRVGKPQARWGLVYVKGDALIPALTTQDAGKLEFEETGTNTSSITAKKALIFPMREIQFQRASIMVTGNKVMQMPLYQLNLAQSTGGSVMTSLVNVNNNQVQVNYPYYLSLKPGQTSLLRFRTGDKYGRSVSGNGGTFIDYELAWNHGDKMDGKFVFGGMGRKDYTLSLQQYLRVDEQTTAFAALEMPAGQSIYGSMNLSRAYDGYNVSLSGSASQYLRGLRYNTQSYSLVAEKDPTKLGKLPARLYVGLTAQQDTNSYLGSSQNGVGVRARLQSLPLQLGDRTTLYAGLSLAQLSGRNTVTGLTTLAEASLRHQLNGATSITATYNYMRDGYNDRFLGRQRVGLEARYYTDRFSLSLLGSKSMDVDRMSLYGDMSLNVLGNWWVSSGYTMDHYLGYNYLDYSMGLGYRIAGREVGLIWSRSTKRIGLQILGAAF